MAQQTLISHTQTLAFLHNYPELIGQSFKQTPVLQGTVNTLYKLHFPKLKLNLFLKIDEKGSQLRLKNEIQWFQRLQKTKLPFQTPCVLKQKRQLTMSLYSKNKPQKWLYLLHEIKGENLKPSQWTSRHIQEMAKAMAHLHKIKISSDDPQHHWTWSNLEKTLFLMKEKILKHSPTLYQTLISEIQTGKKNKKYFSRKTFIHSDLFYDNIHWSKDKLTGLIDFEYAGVGNPLYDMAMTLLANAWENQKLNKKFTSLFLKCYQKINPLPKQSAEEWKLAFTHAALTIVITRLKTFGLTAPRSRSSGYRDYRDFWERYLWVKNFNFSLWL